MGTRTVFQVKDSERNLIANLFANSSHTTQFAESVFESVIKDSVYRAGPNALVERLLSLRYQTNEGAHKQGDRIFWLIPASVADSGDREALVTVIHGGACDEQAQGHVQLAGPAWSYERREV